MKFLPLIIIQLLLIYKIVNSSKILFLLPIASKSHHNVFEPLLNALAQRNHEIVYMSPFKPSVSYPNVESVVAIPPEEVFGKMPTAFEMRKTNILKVVMSFTGMFDDSCHKLYQNERVQTILKENKFDLIYVDILLNYCAVGMLDRFKSPFVYVITSSAANEIIEPAGTHQPPSFVPHTYLPYSDRMTFSERFENTVMQWMLKIVDKFFIARRREEVYRNYLGQETPSIMEFHKEVNMIFVNSHFTMNYPRPFLPDIVEVGGMHCRPGQQIPKDLEDFINGSGDHGFIFFSLGSIAQGSDMPEESRKAFLAVFGKLKQRVIWKWETEEMEGLPENVMVKKFLPQQDLLGHPKIRIFMTHAGLLSIQESIYHGVPLLTIPLFADQDLNARKAEKAGYALTLEIDSFTEFILLDKIQQLLLQSKFAERARQLSNLTRDQSETPLDRAVYWSEYLIRHQGGPHLRSPARDLNTFAYHSIDVFAILAFTFFSAIIILFILVQKIINIFSGIIYLVGKKINSNAVRSHSGSKNNDKNKKTK